MESEYSQTDYGERQSTSDSTDNGVKIVNFATSKNLVLKSSVVSCGVPVGNVSWMMFQDGRSSNFRLRRGVVQAAHTRN